MTHKDKIRIMSKMAIYDKKDFRRDADANQYFRHDFIYKRNMQMRFYVGVGCLILVFFYFMYLMAVQDQDVLSLDFQGEVFGVVIFVLIVMVAYSFIGTIIFTREFLVAQKRVEAYFSLMRRLNGEPEPIEEVLSKKEQRPRFFARKQKPALPVEEEEDDYDEPFVPYQSQRRGDYSAGGYRYSSAERAEDDEKPKR